MPRWGGGAGLGESGAHAALAHMTSREPGGGHMMPASTPAMANLQLSSRMQLLPPKSAAREAAPAPDRKSVV